MIKKAKTIYVVYHKNGMAPVVTVLEWNYLPTKAQVKKGIFDIKQNYEQQGFAVTVEDLFTGVESFAPDTVSPNTAKA